MFKLFSNNETENISSWASAFFRRYAWINSDRFLAGHYVFWKHLWMSVGFKFSEVDDLVLSLSLILLKAERPKNPFNRDHLLFLVKSWEMSEGKSRKWRKYWHTGKSGPEQSSSHGVPVFSELRFSAIRGRWRKNDWSVDSGIGAGPILL